jgi:TorA maturation chaperone TorD
MNKVKLSTDFDVPVNLARQALYRFAALSFADPQVGSWEQLNALRDDPLLFSGAALVRALPAARPSKYGLGECPLDLLDPQTVLDRLPASREALNAQYENTFGLLVSSNCPPYETEYINSKFAFQRSNGLADISGFYAAFGLTTSDLRPERPDHIVLELEFMAALLGLERQAANDASKRGPEHREVCREAQARFLEQHLAWWAPAFAKLLGQQNGQRFYTAAGVFLTALIPAERALLAVQPASRPVLPSSMERPEDCEGCQLAG